MPQSKQMKLQWLTIDGRNVPFALPQHWNGDDWTITGVDNPLPTANYIEKNGIMVPVSENNPVPTQLTGSNVEKLSSKFDEDTVIGRTGNLEVGMWEILFEHYGSECVLQSFALGTDYPNISLFIEARVGNSWERVGIASPNGYIYTPSPYNLRLHSGGNNDFFKIQVYDTEKNNFVVTMTRPMTFSKGLRIRILNQNTENDHTVAVSALVSKKY